MRVRMLTQQSGTRDGAAWPAPGEEVDLPDAEARALVRGGSAEELDTEHDKVLVPPTGIHTPGTVAYEEPGVVDLVEVPTDALADREGTKAAIRAAREGSTTQVPAGTGVQEPTGAALTDKGVQDSVKRSELAAEDFGGAKVGAKPAPAKATKSTGTTKS